MVRRLATSYRQFKVDVIAGVNNSMVSGVSVQRRLWPRASSQIEKETNERRTSNIERPTSNTVFCHFIKRLSKADLSFENMRLA